MANGDLLGIFLPRHMQARPGFIGEPPSFGQPRNGHPVARMREAFDVTARWTAVMPRIYTGSGSKGIDVKIFWTSDTATSGNVVWASAFGRIDEAGQDLDFGNFFGTIVSSTVAAPSTAGVLVYTTNLHTNIQVDGLLPGELFTFYVQRDGGNLSDTMTGDAHLLAVELREETT